MVEIDGAPIFVGGVHSTRPVLFAHHHFAVLRHKQHIALDVADEFFQAIFFKSVAFAAHYQRVERGQLCVAQFVAKRNVGFHIDALRKAYQVQTFVEKKVRPQRGVEYARQAIGGGVRQYLRIGIALGNAPTACVVAVFLEPIHNVERPQHTVHRLRTAKIDFLQLLFLLPFQQRLVEIAQPIVDFRSEIVAREIGFHLYRVAFVGVAQVGQFHHIANHLVEARHLPLVIDRNARHHAVIARLVGKIGLQLRADLRQQLFHRFALLAAVAFGRNHHRIEHNWLVFQRNAQRFVWPKAFDRQSVHLVADERNDGRVGAHTALQHKMPNRIGHCADLRLVLQINAGVGNGLPPTIDNVTCNVDGTTTDGDGQHIRSEQKVFHRCNAY